MSLLKQLITTSPPTGAGTITDAYRKTHEVVGSEGGDTYPAYWETADYDWSALTPDNTAILRSPTTGEPVLYDGKYWMAYGASQAGESEGIGLATSVNLIDWTDEAGNPIIDGTDGAAEDWEKKGVSPTDFLYMGDEAGHANDFWIFYSATNAAKTLYGVGVVKSNDMITWTRDTAHNPIAIWVAGWIGNCNGVEDFRVQKMSTGDWVAVYEANQAPTGGAAIGAAKTEDTLPHTGWADEGQVCSGTFGGDFIANPTLIRRGGTYYAYYEWSDAGVAKIHGMYAAEADIFTLNGWTQMSNPVLSPTAWEGVSIIPNGLIWANSKLQVFYTGNSAANKKIGIATGIGNGLTRYPVYAGDVTDYQIRIIVHYGAGIDSDEDVYLAGKCRTDFGDVRFTSDDGGTQLKYWIQKKVDSDNAIIWVKVPDLPAYPTETTIYIYYGKAAETTTESGPNTWIDYEDWEAYAVDATLPLGDFVAINAEEELKISDNRAYKGSKSLYSHDDSTANRNRADWNFADKIAGGYRFLIALYLDTAYGTSEAFSTAPSTSAGDSCITLNLDAALNIMEYYNTSWHDTGKDFSEDAWHIIELCLVIDVLTWDFRFDDEWLTDRTVRATPIDIAYWGIYFAGKTGKFQGNLGVCCIGKYVDPEPTHSDWGAEEPVMWPF